MGAAPTQALERIAASVSRTVGSDRYDRYFRSQTKMRLDGTRLDVTVPSKFIAELIDRRFGGVLRTAVREALASDTGAQSESGSINYEVNSQAFGRSVQAADGAGSPAARSSPARSAGRATALTGTVRGRADAVDRYSLDTFLVGTSNQLAHAAAVRIASEDGAGALHRLFVQGECGVGKTHLLRAVAARFKQVRPQARVRYATGEEFTNEFILAIRNNSLEAFRRSYRRVDLLCLDDAHFLSNKDKTQTELLHTFDAIDLVGARIVIASDEHPRDIRELSQQLASRFLAAGVVRIEPPELELRERIARAGAARRGLKFEDAAIRLLAERAGPRNGTRTSVRDLEGAMTQVEALARVSGQSEPGGVMPTVTAGLVKRALHIRDDGAPGRTARPVPFQLLIAEVCRELSVTHEDFCGRGRHKRVVLARSLSAFLGRSLTTLSYPEMARIMGRPTHSTLIMACARIRDRLDDGKDPGLADEIGSEGVGLSLRELCDRLRTAVLRAAERGAPAPERAGPAVIAGR